MIEKKLEKSVYQSRSAFYYILDFKTMPFFERYDSAKDNASEICEEILLNYGIVMVPTSDFGHPNAARISLVIEGQSFTEAINELTNFFTTKA